nr:leucine-rich repeat domain-containing protein [Lachnospiraceae bacterium]
MKKQFSFLLAIVIVMSHVILNVPVNISAEQVPTEDFTVVDGVLSAYSGPGGHVIIPDNITSISANTFLNRTDITSVSFPQGLKSIESKAFSGCTGLSSLDFPDSLIYIHYQAFFNCSGLTSVSFPESITIGEYAFHGCSKLSTLSFPIDAYIQMWAFERCSGLTSVYFSRGVYLEQGSFLYTNPVFYGYSGSSAESYAQKTGISFVPLYGHDHTLQMTSAKPATATENGNISYGYCIICEKYYSDKEGKTEITLADTVIPKTGTTAAKPSTSDDAPATVGTTFPDSKKNSFFKITSTNKKKPTATYVAPTNKNKKTVSIPSSV